MWSPGSISNSLPTLNTTKVALSSLTDRCSKQQKKLEDVEREKILLRVENEQLNKSLNQFDQENLVLREKNLELSHRLERDQEQISDLQRHLDSIEYEATQVSNKETCRNAGDEDYTNSSFNLSATDTTVNRSSDVTKEDLQLLEEVVKVGHSMDTLRNALLDQQNFVRHLIENSKQQPSQSFKINDQAYNKNQNNDDKELLSLPPSDDKLETTTTTTHRNISSSERSSKLNNSLTLPNPAQDEVLTHQGLGDGISARPECIGTPDDKGIIVCEDQVCPMCEARFSSIEVAREDFVTHVNSHFSFEDDLETLQNYEIIQP